MMADLVGSNRRGSLWPGGIPQPAIYPIRALETSAELIASYGLRYQMYRELGYIDHRDALLEVDEYDVSSIPFGAFDPVTGALIGTLRMITTAPQLEYRRLICDLLDDVGDPE